MERGSESFHSLNPFILSECRKPRRTLFSHLKNVQLDPLLLDMESNSYPMVKVYFCIL